MSRQILSYADLGPITSITTPIPRPSSPHPLPSPARDKDKDSPRSPPRKRLRTNNDSDDIPSSPTPKDNINNGTVVVAPQEDAERNRDDLGAHTRKRKKVQRPGNPSGVPWTLHWDAQNAQEEVSYDANGAKVTTTLAYDEGDADSTMMNTSAASASASVSNNHNAANTRRGDGRGGVGQSRPSVSHRNSNKWNGGGMNGPTSKTMLPPPPPPPSFIGPVIPPSNTENRNAGGAVANTTGNLVGSREPERKGRRKNGNAKGNRKAKEKEKEAVSLVNEEEWDDSALIDAWNAAEEEYREMNGGKKWRCEPVKHSSLWHDEFHEDTDEDPSDNDNETDDYEYDDDAFQDSLGVIEETAVEQSYDLGSGHAHAHASASSSTQVLFGQAFASSSGMPSPHPDAPALFGNLPAPVPFGTTRSSIMEEAFRRAQEASYTAGYWTAVYQMHASQKDLLPPAAAQSSEKKLDGNGMAKRGDDGALVGDLVTEEEEGEIEEEEVFLPTQR